MGLDSQEKLRLDANPIPAATIRNLSAQERRALRKAQPSPRGPSVYKTEDLSIASQVGDVPIRVYYPDEIGPFPALVWFHGGGWIQGDIDTFDGTARQLCVVSQNVVISVDYRLSPESKFPDAVEDCYTAIQWTVQNAASINVDPQLVSVGGDSAGGNLAAVMSLMARDKGGPDLACQVLVYPVTDHNFTTRSYITNGNGYGLTKDDMVFYWNQYLKNETDAKNPYAAPAQADDLRNLPPALVITAEYDPLCDEGYEYSERLKQSGVSTLYRRYDGVAHGFLGAWSMVDKALHAINCVGATLKKLAAGEHIE
mgnify:CR=1 FL=1